LGGRLDGSTPSRSGGAARAEHPGQHRQQARSDGASARQHDGRCPGSERRDRTPPGGIPLPSQGNGDRRAGEPPTFHLQPAWVCAIKAPTLLLWTDHDPTGGLDEAQLLLDWLPDARLHVIEDAGHWPQWEKPDEYLRVHRQFLILEEDPS
jgi:pimeloyl-ACP methyl ester carboxylesterase